METGGRGASLCRQLSKKIPRDSLVIYRIFFGLMMVFAVARQFYYGWIDQFYLSPTFHFFYEGFSWVRALPSPWMECLFLIVGISALGIALGWFHRWFCLLFFCSFTYIELIDKTTYLNHYYLVSLLAVILALMPIGSGRGSQINQAWLWLLRFQVGLVYFFAGVAKLGYDWLVLAQPLKIWLAANQDFPLIGPFFAYEETAYLASWSGALFDLTVPFLLCFRKTRVPAFLAVVVFHGLTAKLFNLGMFPWLMIGNASLFFPSDWPKRLGITLRFKGSSQIRDFPKALILPIALYLLVQILLPFRHHLYGGNLLWHEQGFRFSWKVMLIEKAGVVRFIGEDADGQQSLYYPHDYLSPVQVKTMSTQADMIVQFAHFLGQRQPNLVAVYAESFVALNGRRSHPYMNSEVNLLLVSSLHAGDHVLPFPE
ncbi:HTTM domain-containing protein [Pseudobacteriovorax antillogorgiicola]|uniref:Vitamin K-dependent gamma-carboxylase n=1 Tax=Pseudobacteriovorax antillogorgiicola TaxID=1513793 RepID=A0A1Y6CKG1_9BACT|nr:HTTM domain-containing protein [Pseudobacteriovorax antillogorgiicola]TCS47673.1 vitamin K-dependent gamma-carboxylase-like protein [Pseudobacteriovorax antillogorgiicola]SMF59621.1 Vitamin K-dependent gamma-carboxylase [Pseudobacteriovorax antillogorgiicola]